MTFRRISAIRLCTIALCGMILALLPDRAVAEDTEPTKLAFRTFQSATPLKIDDVCCGQIVFPDAAVSVAGAGVGGPPVWIKLPALPAGTVLVISKMVDEATLYEPVKDDTQPWRISRVGDSVEPNGRALRVPPMAFVLSDDTRADAARYLRVVQPNTVRFGLAAWEPEPFYAELERRRVIQMLLLGFISAIVAYNLVVSALTRDSVFAMNALSILSLLLIDLYLSGLGALSLWPRAFSNTMLILGLVGTSFFGSLFISRFLFSDLSHRAARPVLVCGFLALLAGATTLFLPYWYPQTALILITLLMLLVAVGTAVTQVYRRNPNAYLLGFPLLGIMLPGGSLVALRSLTEVSVGAIQPHLLEITLALEALAFSLALASRIRSQKLAVVSARAQLAEAEIDSARRYAELQEKERARIASDLHDSIGHNLVMISGLMENKLASGEQSESLAKVSKLTRRTLQQIRQLSHALHPSTLSDLGWTAAVDSLFESLDRSYGIAVEVKKNGEEPDLTSEEKVHLYRILQELVSNIAKHSSATACHIQFDNDGKNLTIELADDGVGFAPGQDPVKGLGMASIEERLKAIRGEWNLSAGASGGLVTRLKIPVGKVGTDG